MAPQIHPTAIVDPGARIGEGTSVGPYAVIEEDTRIGDNCSIGPHAMIGCGTRIGNGCRIFKSAAVGLIPQDLKFHGEKTFLRIGDNTTIREFCTLNRGTEARGETVIGSNCLLMAYCHVAHDCVLGDHVVIANNLAMAGHVEVGDHARIGGTVVIHQFCRIGAYAFLGVTTKVVMDILPFAMVAAEPTRIADINKVGLERAGFDSARRRAIKRAFRTIFRRGLELDDAIESLVHEYPDNQDVAEIVSFVRGSSRGILR